MHSQRNFVLNIGFGRSPTSIFEVGFEKSDSKNCELVPASNADVYTSAILRCKILVGNTQTLELHRADAG